MVFITTKFTKDAKLPQDKIRPSCSSCPSWCIKLSESWTSFTSSP